MKTQRSSSASWPFFANCATASAPRRRKSKRRSTSSTLRAPKGNPHEHDRHSAKLSGKVDASRLPRSRTEDRRGGGVRHHVSQHLAELELRHQSRFFLQ